MITKQQKIFKPVTITLETQQEYNAFVEIIDEAENVKPERRDYMGPDAVHLALDMSCYFSRGE